MNEGRDVEPLIAKFSEPLQQKARRFVETDKTIHDLDAELVRVNRNRMPAKYEQYTLPGEKSNYTEKLLTLPGNGPKGLVMRQGESAVDALNRQHAENPRFQSSHFDEPNVLAHVRYDERPTVDGKRALFINELQSDWHLKGRQEGYQNPAPTKLPDGVYIVPDNGFFQVVNREGNPLLRRTWASEADARNAALEHYGEGAGNRGVPNAPFKTSWHELAIKRMLREAAERGYDRLAWATGDQVSNLYDLSKHVDSLRYTHVPETDLYHVDAMKDGRVVVSKTGLKKEELPSFIGKDVAQKIVNGTGDLVKDNSVQPWRKLSGVDLKVGGDWARNLYDKTLVNFLNQYAKKWSAKVGESEISTTNPGSLRYEILDPKGNVYDAFRNRTGAEDAMRGYQDAHRGPGKWTVRDNGTTDKVHSIEINKKMRDSVLKQGQPISKNEPPAFDWQSAVMNG
jgi:hypothetical protein